MNILTDNELMDVKGGGISLGAAALIVLGVTFLIGVIDGYIRPFSCN